MVLPEWQQRALKPPRDTYPYKQDARARLAGPGLPAGLYVYVIGGSGEAYVLPDEGHTHPLVLGGAKPAYYAGVMKADGDLIENLTNLSGTFRFDDREGLLLTSRQLELQGMLIWMGAVKFHPFDGGQVETLR